MDLNGWGICGDWVREVHPVRRFEDLILPDETERELRDLVAEWERVTVLRSYGLEPKRRVLLKGPYADTAVLTEALAHELGFGLIVMRNGGLIGDSFVQTRDKIYQVMAIANQRHPTVLSFDRLDRLIQVDGMGRIVSLVLADTDRVPRHVLLVASVAGYPGEGTDLWSTFQLHLEVPRLDANRIERWVEGFERRMGLPLGIDPRPLTEVFAGSTLTELEDFMSEVVRRALVTSSGLGDAVVNDVVADRLAWYLKYGRQSLG